MRVVRVGLSLTLLFANFSIPVSSSCPPQQISAPAGATALQQSLSVLASSVVLNDVALTGSVRRIVGSDDQSGSITLAALSSGAARADLIFSSGTRTEISASSSADVTGSWAGPDRAVHTTPFHNLLSEPAWFFPAFALAHRGAATYTSFDLGLVEYGGKQLRRVTTFQTFTLKSPDRQALLRRLSQVDFYLDPISSLPMAIAFNVHPDTDALTDIPVEIRFSDYRSIAGAQIPFHIQKSFNGSLLLDIQIQTITVNSGLSANFFASL